MNEYIESCPRWRGLAAQPTGGGSGSESRQREESSYDEEGVRQAVRLFLKSIGEDPEREGLVETPDRIARACRELFAGLQAGEQLTAGTGDAVGCLHQSLALGILTDRLQEQAYCLTHAFFVV